jgi:hypothetical protein
MVARAKGDGSACLRVSVLRQPNWARPTDGDVHSAVAQFDVTFMISESDHSVRHLRNGGGIATSDARISFEPVMSCAPKL